MRPLPGPPSRARRANRLIHEKSPYLLQHAHNPVDWRPWGEAAFAEARREQKPIFLSIGYSTCHWCHVMERESFEDDSVAEALNRDFVPIKVDREERPDVDRIYMTAMQAMGLGGGWPLNVFLTPELEPFYGGTYFAPGTRPERPGMLQLLPRIHEAWHEHRAEVTRDGARVLEALSALDRVEPAPAAAPALLERAYQEMASAYDPAHGGFGHAPKFPSPGNLDFLLRVWARDPARHAPALAMVRRQLDAMRDGGIHDQIGGGFHRYSTDRAWLVPHFEKMLYDQALLARAYLEAHQATGDVSYAETAEGILRYVDRDLSSPGAASIPPRMPTARARKAGSTSGRRTRSKRCWGRSRHAGWNNSSASPAQATSKARTSSIARVRSKRASGRRCARRSAGCSRRAARVCGPTATTR